MFLWIYYGKPKYVSKESSKGTSISSSNEIYGEVSESIFGCIL